PIFVWGKTMRKYLSRWVNLLILGAILILGALGIESCQISFGLMGLVLASLIPLSLWAEFKLQKPNLNSYAMLFSHGGFAVAIMGMSILNLGSSKTTISLKQGETASYQEYTFHLKGIKTLKMPTYEARQAYLEIKQGQKESQVVIPEKRFYESSQALTT